MSIIKQYHVCLAKFNEFAAFGVCVCVYIKMLWLMVNASFYVYANFNEEKRKYKHSLKLVNLISMDFSADVFSGVCYCSVYCINPVVILFLFILISCTLFLKRCSIRHCGCFCRWTLIGFWAAHWMFARFQWIRWCGICGWYRSIRVKVLIWTAAVRWLCTLRVQWHCMVLFVILLTVEVIPI